MDALVDVEDVVARFSASPSGPVGEADGAKRTATSTPNGIRSSPPVLVHEDEIEVGPPNGPLDDSGVKSDSEAETIVLPGKDGHSPSKIRKSIKHEDKSDGEEIEDAVVSGSGGGGEVAGGSKSKKVEGERSEREANLNVNVNTATSLGKRKRPKTSEASTDINKDDSSQHGDSSLSSVPSPVATTRSSLSKPAASNSDISRSPSPHSTRRDKAKSVDRILPRKKHFDATSGDEGETRTFNRQRSSGAEQKQSREKTSSRNTEFNSRKHTRSNSPPARGHRRSASTQLATKSAQVISHKKRPPPLQSTEYPSDDSSESEGSHPRSSRLRHLAAPTTGDSAISPAKMPPHKRHVDRSGQTELFKRCVKGELESVQEWLEERPGELNEADHARNTPLHSASLFGHADVVSLLLAAGCTVDPVNAASDTPLHDAIENGHLDVVKLLLDAGANPRKANGKGEDPYDLVEEDTEVTEEMREAITAAKQKTNDVRRMSDDDQMHDNTDRLSHPKGSPRQTPPIQSHDSLVTGRRNASTRAVKTSDRVLYQPLNLSELRRAAGQNDISTVVRILDVHNNNLDDPRSLIIAAKAGHHDVINLLFGYGQFNPDPEALDHQPPESATPILAAIGRENLEVLKLFLNAANFDPTRRVNGDTYYEIAKKRAGSLWKEEEALLKEAYDKYKKTHKSSPGQPRSPGLRRDGRATDHDTKRSIRKEEQPSQSHKQTASSPRAKNPDLDKSTSRSSQSIDGKKASGKLKREERSTSADLSDRENGSLGPPKQKSRKSESEVAVASENETVKPRRKLISGKEFRGEREQKKQRRASITSTASNVSLKDKRDGDGKSDSKIVRMASPSVPRISKTRSLQEHESASERHPFDSEKAPSLKRDISKDRLSTIRSESPVKRPRKSETPPRSGMQEVTTGYEGSGGPQKKRKLEGDSRKGIKTENNVEGLSSSSPDHRTSKTATSSSSKPSSSEKGQAKSSSNPEKTDRERVARSIPKKIKSPERTRHSQVDDKKTGGISDFSKPNKSDNEKPSKEAVAEALKAEEDRESQKRLEKEAQEEQARRDKEAHEAQARLEREELEAKEKAELEEKLEEERIAQAKEARLAREEAAREEEMRRQQEESERRERQRQEDAEAHAREQERQRALYLEQEKLRKEDQERRRAQIQEQQRAERMRVEKEKKLERLAKLPLLLRWLDLAQDPKNPDIASLFRFIEGFRYDTIKPEATGQPNGREQWMLNTQVALLLGEKDLQLSRYTAWEREPLSLGAKQAIWKIENGIYSLQHPNLAALYRQFSDEGFPGQKVIEQSKPLFLGLDLFFVKVSEFMFVVPNFPHLRGLELVVKYRELEKTPVWPPRPGKWRGDPDVDPNQSFAPRPNYYINGEFVRRGETLRTKTSTTALGERRVPRRGLLQVFPHEPDYLTLAREQGLFWLLPEFQSNQQAFQSNQIQPQPQLTNGITPPNSEPSKSINGGSPSLTNGVHQLGDTVMENGTT